MFLPATQKTTDFHIVCGQRQDYDPTIETISGCKHILYDIYENPYQLPVKMLVEYHSKCRMNQKLRLLWGASSSIFNDDLSLRLGAYTFVWKVCILWQSEKCIGGMSLRKMVPRAGLEPAQPLLVKGF